MTNRNLMRGLVLIVISLAFGLQSFRYPFGSLGRVGPGMFPLVISSLLFLTGGAIAVQSRYGEVVRLEFAWKNISLIIVSLIGFAVLSEFVNMTVGIVFLVFTASLCASRFSLVRSTVICASLLGIAFVFAKFLGLSLPLL